ncbi:hypothetical protein [Flexithrix dorotheae]|uniref:hypothetical protein n=1 Tax=Flexithrix dorotheae TaxID=70993 RepID=UPI00035F8231|nr:hypothetical protein [Flexithrix dorotheae]
MEKLLEELKQIEFTTGPNFCYDLDREFVLLSSYLEIVEQENLKADFNRFFEKGRFLLLNTFGGGILFLKVPEWIEKIKIDFRTVSNDFEASVVFESETRRSENIKSKPGAGKIESIRWSAELMFPNIHQYPKLIQKALLIIIGKIVKRICEYGRTNFAYMKIENEFVIELLINGHIESELGVE